MGIYCRACNTWIKWAAKDQRAQLEGNPNLNKPQDETIFKLDIIVEGLKTIEDKLDQILGGSG
jgi:hypothetical protein